MSPLNSILEQVKALPLDQQIEVAEAIDQITWSQRWRRVCERVGLRAASAPISDEDIDSIVREVRREQPLSERSSTRRS